MKQIKLTFALIMLAFVAGCASPQQQQSAANPGTIPWGANASGQLIPTGALAYAQSN